jgi:hypothetical protein
MPDGSTSTSFLIRPDQIETFLAIGRHINSDHFSSLSYETQRVLLAATVAAPIGVDSQRRFLFQIQPGLHQPL